MADKLLCIPNDDTQNYPFCRLKLVVEIKIQKQSPWLLSQKNAIIRLWRLV